MISNIMLLNKTGICAHPEQPTGFSYMVIVNEVLETTTLCNVCVNNFAR